MATLTSKFELGQKLWTLDGKKAKAFVIERISISVDSSLSTFCIYYSNGLKDSKFEDELFETKDDLIASLFDEENEA